MARGVVVGHPYGTDNRVVLDALRASQGLRGTGIVKPRYRRTNLKPWPMPASSACAFTTCRMGGIQPAGMQSFETRANHDRTHRSS